MVAVSLLLARHSPTHKTSGDLEIALLRSLSHPNITRYYSSFVHERHLHIVIEYAEGGDLSDAIRQQKGVLFPEPTIINWTKQLCSALAYIHGKRILHRDIKAQNVFLTGDRQNVKLGDFGVATLLQSTQAMAKTVIGTPHYLSPEICSGSPYSNKSDIWALGCLVYEMAALKHAFNGTNIAQVALRILTGTYEPIPLLYSPQLTVMIRHILQQSPKDRPSAAMLLRSPVLAQQTATSAPHATYLRPIDPTRPVISDTPEKPKQTSVVKPAPSTDLTRRTSDPRLEFEARRQAALATQRRADQERRGPTPPIEHTSTSKPSSVPMTLQPAVARPASDREQAMSAEIDRQQKARDDFNERRKQAELNRQQIQADVS